MDKRIVMHWRGLGLEKRWRSIATTLMTRTARHDAHCEATTPQRASWTSYAREAVQKVCLTTAPLEDRDQVSICCTT